MSRLLRLLPIVAALVVAAPLAAAELELNRASRAELEQLRGIGVEMAERLLDERERRPFADWSDAMKRVPGLKRRLAAQLSRDGLRVQGRALDP